MSKKTESKPKLKEVTITLRITEEMDAHIEAIRVCLNEGRGSGLSEVTKTEAIRSLIIMGRETFNLSKKNKKAS